MKSVYQFKITLQNIKPSVWRRIQVPEDYSFWDLHVAIQDAMGWYDYHLHEFSLLNFDQNNKRIGLPSDDFPDEKVLPSWEEKIKDWFSLEKNKAMNYIYDFGDSWRHRIELEKVLDKDPNLEYPICLKGKRACPKEDSGGVWGYEHKLKILKDPKHPEYEDIKEWMGEDFNPEEFDCEDVAFDDPADRLKNSDFLEDYTSKPEQIEDNNLKKLINWEIDYVELDHPLKDDEGKMIKPFLMLIVHPESYFVLGSHLASPRNNYLQEFADKILELESSGQHTPERIIVRKIELFNVLKTILSGKNIKLELVKQTKFVDEVIRDFKNEFFTKN